MSLTLCIHVPLSSISLWLFVLSFVSFSASASLSLSICASVCVFIAGSISDCVSVCAFSLFAPLSLCFPLSLPPLSLSLPPSLSLSLSLSLSHIYINGLRLSLHLLISLTASESLSIFSISDCFKLYRSLVPSISASNCKYIHAYIRVYQRTHA